MKRFFTIFALLLLFIPAMAQEMHIDNAGNSTVIKLSDFEKMTFEGSTVTVSQTDGTSSDYEMEDITRIHFGYYQTGISASMQEDAVRYISAEEIGINASCGTPVYLYDITGTQLSCTRLKEHSMVISLSQYPKGIYIIRAGEQTLKVVRR